MASAGIFEATVSLGESIQLGSSFYLSEVKDVFKKFNADISPDFLSYILNIAKFAKKNVKFLKNDDFIIVANDVGMMYKTALSNIQFPTNISKEFLPESTSLSVANFDSRTLMTSLAKLEIALYGVKSPELYIQYNPRRHQADVYVKSLSNQKSKDSWAAGDMLKNKIGEFSILLDLLKNSISILDNDLSIEVYEDFITLSDNKQIIVLAVTEK